MCSKLLVVVVGLLVCAGCNREPPNPPIAEFQSFAEKFVAGLNKRPADTPTRQDSYGIPSVDIKKTDSLVNPVVGVLTVSETITDSHLHGFYVGYDWQFTFAPDGKGGWRQVGESHKETEISKNLRRAQGAD